MRGWRSPDTRQTMELVMQQPRLPDRRATLGLVGGAIATAFGVSETFAAQKAFFQRLNLTIGLQLYTLGPDLAANLDHCVHGASRR